jgi:apolipoprotein N-acyltransferase
MLGHSQYQRTAIIQIADIFGAEGVSFLVAMVNGAIADLVIAGGRKKLVRLWPAVAVVVAVCGVLGAVAYGRWRIKQSDEMISMGPVAASVQSNVPQSVKELENAESDVEIMLGLLTESREAANAGPELTVWPETMVQASLDRRILRVLSDPNHTYRVFDEVLQNHARQTGYLLVGAYGGRPEITEKGDIQYAARYNSAFLYQPDGHQAFEQYNKIHLVPFGEVVPFRKSWPWLYRQLMRFTPYNYEYSLDYGTDYTAFEMFTKRDGDEQRYRFGVLICYEGTIPNIARRLAKPVDGKKGVDFLVNISNDGWFVQYEDGKPQPSAELAQHAVVTAFRAVENRVSIVRSVNTGISCLIDPLGRIHNGFLAGNLPEKALERKGMAGWFVDKIPVDKRVALFTVWGPWLGICCAVGLAAALAAPLAERFFRKKKTSGVRR